MSEDRTMDNLPKGSKCPRCFGTGKCTQILTDPKPVHIPGMAAPVKLVTGFGEAPCKACNGKGTL